jgi:hypothetical protein
MTRKRTSEKDLVVSAAGAAAPARRKAAIRPRGQRDAEPVAPLAPVVTEPEIVAPQEEVAATVLAPTYEEIAKLAYSYWEARGYQGGSADEDWARAEQELRLHVSAAVA